MSVRIENKYYSHQLKKRATLVEPARFQKRGNEMSVLLGVIAIINFVQLLLVGKVAYTWRSFQNTLALESAIAAGKATHYSEQLQTVSRSRNRQRHNMDAALRSHDPQRCMHTNAHGTEFSEAVTFPGRSVGLHFCLKQMLTRPRIEFLQNRPDLSSERGQRVFNTHRHFGEHLSFDKSVPLKFSQLLRQYLLRDSRHALPEECEPERLFAAHKPPENDWLPPAPNQNEQFLDRTLADNMFSAHSALASAMTRPPIAAPAKKPRRAVMEVAASCGEFGFCIGDCFLIRGNSGRTWL
jgi:hypothetical protein